MSVALWIVTALLAAAFLAAGLMKIVTGREQLLERMGWVADFTARQVRLIGVAEVVGALGLVLPAVTGVAPVLVPVAAAALVLLMVGAVVTHVRRGDPAAGVASPAVLGALTLVVMVGRFGPAAF